MIKILNGENRGFFAFLIRLILLPFSFLYGVVICAKLFLYKVGIFKQRRIDDVEIICIGNLSAGGTGKTPAVLYMLKLLQNFEERIAVVSRGYGKSNDEALNDEGNLINSKFPEVLQFQDPYRFFACVEAKKAGAKCIILDDGFSHMKLARDFDIVLIDATRPFSRFELLPRGLLREPPISLKRAGAILITRSDQVSTHKLELLIKKIRRYVKERVLILNAKHKPLHFVDMNTGEFCKDSEIKGKKAFAFAGIGNPKSFEKSCIELGLNIAKFKRFPDHHAYTEQEIIEIHKIAKQNNAEILVTTSKDAVKISKFQLKENMPMLFLEIEFAITNEDEMQLINLLSAKEDG